MLKYLFILTICTLGIAKATPKHGDASLGEISGVVVDEVSGLVLKGAVISLERNGEIIRSVESDGKGHFYFKYDAHFMPLDNVKIGVTKKGYYPQKLKPLFDLEEGMKIELQSKTKFEPYILRSGSRSSFGL